MFFFGTNKAFIFVLLLGLASTTVVLAKEVPPEGDVSGAQKLAGLESVIGRQVNLNWPAEFTEKVLSEASIYAHQCLKKSICKPIMTFWWPISGDAASEPRCVMEVAVESLLNVAFGRRQAALDAGIIGGEFWAVTEGDQKLHTDLDELLARDHGVLETPAVATVTYLRDTGAATIGLDQSPSYDASGGLVPLEPSQGFLSLPTAGTHLLFRGNLQHGIFGKLKPKEGNRTTFLVNWWLRKPLAPFCDVMETDKLSEIGLLDKMEARRWSDRLRQDAPQPLAVHPKTVPASDTFSKVSKYILGYMHFAGKKGIGAFQTKGRIQIHLPSSIHDATSGMLLFQLKPGRDCEWQWMLPLGPFQELVGGSLFYSDWEWKVFCIGFVLIMVALAVFCKCRRGPKVEKKVQ